MLIKMSNFTLLFCFCTYFTYFMSFSPFTYNGPAFSPQKQCHSRSMGVDITACPIQVSKAKVQYQTPQMDKCGAVSIKQN